MMLTVDGLSGRDAKAGGAIIDEAMKKAAVVWVSVGGQPALALWCLPLAGSLYLVSGLEAPAGADSDKLHRRGEQSAPGLATATQASVTVRGDHGGRIVTWPAEVTRVEPGTEEWETVALQLAAKRLNAPGTAEALAARWAAECVLTRLTPAGEPIEAGGSLPDGSLAAAPRPTPAARRTPKPFRLHRIRQPQ